MAAVDDNRRYAPVFICGTGRSGTSFLNKILRSHPGFFGLRFEGRFIVLKDGLLDLCSKFPCERKKFVTFREKMLGHWYYKEIDKGTRVRKIGLHTEFSLHEIEQALNQLEESVFSAREHRQLKRAGGKFLETIFASGANRKNESRWVEKTPTNLIYMSSLHQLLPEALFLHIVRDPRDVAASIMQRGFWPIGRADQKRTGNVFKAKNPASCGRYWRTMIEHGHQEKRGIPESNYLEFRYEDLVRDLADARHCDVNALPNDNVVMKIFNYLNESISNKFIKRIEVREGSVGRYKESYTDDELRVIEQELKYPQFLEIQD